MTYKVGDKINVVVEIVDIDDFGAPYFIKLIGMKDSEAFWVFEKELVSSKVDYPEQRRKEIEEQIQDLLNEMESLK